METKAVQKDRKYFTTSEKHKIIQEVLLGELTKKEIWKKHTGQDVYHGKFLAWMRKLGYDTDIPSKSKFVLNNTSMAKSSEPPSSEDSFETLKLKKRIAELKKQLKDAELKAIAFSTMVDIAEKEFKIPIRKKFNTKP